MNTTFRPISYGPCSCTSDTCVGSDLLCQLDSRVSTLSTRVTCVGSDLGGVIWLSCRQMISLVFVHGRGSVFDI